MIDELRSRTGAMVDLLGDLVAIESPSADVDAVSRCADAVAAAARDLLGVDAERLDAGDRPALRWRFGGATRVLLVGHLDTVWPTGTVDRWPFTVDGDKATGPGAFDMKAGIVQALHALSLLDDLDGVTLLLNADEEIGSGGSRRLIEESARGAVAALVLEPSAGGALKTARKGVSMYEIRVHGRAAHAGLEPEKGANAVVELAHQVLRLTEVARPDLGTTVTPTVASAGTTMNTVPALASVSVDVRAATPDEQARVNRDIVATRGTVDGTTVEVLGGPNRPPLPASSSNELFAMARSLADELGIGALAGVEVGGGSDGNFTAGVGVPTLDGLGAVGDHAHGEGEYVVVPAMAERAALVAALVTRLLDQG